MSFILNYYYNAYNGKKGRDKMSNLGNTQYFKVPQEQKLGVEEIFKPGICGTGRKRV